jgi:iron complex outermembrane receptor protein
MRGLLVAIIILQVWWPYSPPDVRADEAGTSRPEAGQAPGGSAEGEVPIAVKDVVITSTRLPDVPVDVRHVPTNIKIITAEDIQRTGAKTVQEALQWTTGIVWYDAVGNAFQQTIDLRGFNGQPVPNTSVFVDGQRINEPDFNTINFDLIPFDTIERIEIVPGSSAIYGKNAMGGVINIVTKRGGEKRQVTGELLFGSFGRQRYTLQATGPIGKFDYYANGARETETGYRDQSNARISRFYGRLGYRPSEATDLTISYTYVDDHLKQAGSLPINQAEVDPRSNFTPGDFTANEPDVVRLNARQSLPLGFSLNANGFYRHLSQEQVGVGQPLLVGGMLTTSQTTTTTQSGGGAVQLTHDASPFGLPNKLILGGEGTKNDVTGQLVSNSDFGPFNSQQDINEETFGLFAQDSLQVLPSLLLTAGVRFDWDRISGTFQDTFTPSMNASKTFSRVTPRVGFTYTIVPEASLFFNYTEGFRIPTFQELFQIVGASNPNLNAVVSQNYEVGVRARIGNVFEGTLALFRADVRNEIFFTCTVCDPLSPAFDGINRNVESSRRQGLELTLKARPNRYFDALLNYTYTEAEFRSTFNLSATQTIEPGDIFPLVPQNRLSVTGNVHPAPGWTVSLIGLYVSSQVYLNDEVNTRPRLPDYFLLNGRVSYELPVRGGRLSAFLLGTNLTNQSYYSSGIIATNTLTGGGALQQFVVPVPTLAVYGGLSYRFEGL